MEPTFFATPADFRAWLQAHHDTESELLVGFYKKGSGKPSITWPESVDEALCFGWIDGVRRSAGPDAYTIRFTPRRAKSGWSEVNLKRARELIEMGRMTPAGLRAYEARDAAKSKSYSYENRAQPFSPELEERFRANAQAWDFFQTQPPYYRKTVTFWVMSAKQEATRIRRLDQLIAECADQRRMDLLTGPAKSRENPAG